ncbi:MAG: DNA primase noncatalytic subunit PriX [Candidatus Nitrosocosmicus sp.]
MAKRLPSQLLLKDFRRWIAQEEINHEEEIKKSIDRRSSANESENSFTIDWIERLIETPIEDHRNYCLWRIIGPYLLNVRKLSELEASKIMEEWLDRCSIVRKLDFEPRLKIYSIIKGNKGYKPISFAKLKEEYHDLFSLIDSKEGIAHK